MGFSLRCCVKWKPFRVSKKFSLCNSLFHSFYICSHLLHIIGLELNYCEFGINCYLQGLVLTVLTDSYIFTLINSTITSSMCSFTLYQHALLHHCYLIYTLGKKTCLLIFFLLPSFWDLFWQWFEGDIAERLPPCLGVQHSCNYFLTFKRSWERFCRIRPISLEPF